MDSDNTIREVCHCGAVPILARFHSIVRFFTAIRNSTNRLLQVLSLCTASILPPVTAVSVQSTLSGGVFYKQLYSIEKLTFLNDHFMRILSSLPIPLILLSNGKYRDELLFRVTEATLGTVQNSRTSSFRCSYFPINFLFVIAQLLHRVQNVKVIR